MMRCLSVLLLTVALFSCSDNTMPSGVLPPKKMQDVLWDFIRIDIFTTEFLNRDSSNNLAVENVKLQKEVFLKHKITRDEFYKSYKYYESHPEEMEGLLDSMIVNKRREELKKDSTKLKKMTTNE